jgi:hypothetical protein
MSLYNIHTHQLVFKLQISGPRAAQAPGWSASRAARDLRRQPGANTVDASSTAPEARGRETCYASLSRWPSIATCDPGRRAAVHEGGALHEKGNINNTPPPGGPRLLPSRDHAQVHLRCLPLNNIVLDSVPRAAPRDRELRLPTGIHYRYGFNKIFRLLLFRFKHRRRSILPIKAAAHLSGHPQEASLGLIAAHVPSGMGALFHPTLGSRLTASGARRQYPGSHTFRVTNSMTRPLRRALRPAATAHLSTSPTYGMPGSRRRPRYQPHSCCAGWRSAP